MSYKRILMLSLVGCLAFNGQMVFAQETSVDSMGNLSESSIESSTQDSEVTSMEETTSVEETTAATSLSLEELHQELMAKTPLTEEQWSQITNDRWQTYLDENGQNLKGIFDSAVKDFPKIFEARATEIKSNLVTQGGVSENLVTGVEDLHVLWAFSRCMEDYSILASQLEDGVTMDRASYQSYMSTPYSKGQAEELVNPTLLQQVKDLFIYTLEYSEESLAKLPEDAYEKILVEFLTSQPKSADGFGFNEVMTKLYPEVSKENPEAKTNYTQPVVVKVLEGEVASLVVEAVDSTQTTTFEVITTATTIETATTQAVTTAANETTTAAKKKGFLPTTGEQALPIVGIAGLLLLVGGFILMKNRRKK